MTRTEFIDNVTSWFDLLSFCNENPCDICDSIMSNEEMDEYIDDNLVNEAESNRWYELRDLLNDIPTGYDYYINHGYFEFSEADDSDFNSYKDDVLEWGDNNDIWDYDEDEDEEPPLIPNFEEEFTVEEEPMSIYDLMKVCNSEIQEI